MPLHLGEHSYGAPTIHGEMNNIYVGKYCAIANSAVFDGGIGHNHHAVTGYPLWRLGYAEKNPAGMCKGDIRIGNDVWIGDGALIMSGIEIGDGAVIAARAVVTKNVEPYTVVGGSPARNLFWRYSPSQNKVQGYLSRPEIIDKLLEIMWWDWPDHRVREFSKLLMSEDIDTFIDMCEKSFGPYSWQK